MRPAPRLCQSRSSEPVPRGPPRGVPDFSYPHPHFSVLTGLFGHTHPMTPAAEHPSPSDDALRPLGEAGSGERRPWGEFVILDDGPSAKVKRITVEPGQRLSYQSHDKRSEHWIVVEGTAIVTLDNIDHTVPAGSTIEIPVHTKHRVRNDSAAPVVFIEVQTGTYFGEDDIVRYEDDYGRAGS